MVSYWFNPNEIAESAALSLFNHDGSNKDSIMTVTARERQAAKAASGLYYLCVQPLMTSTYSIMMQEVNPND